MQPSSETVESWIERSVRIPGLAYGRRCELYETTRALRRSSKPTGHSLSEFRQRVEKWRRSEESAGDQS